MERRQITERMGALEELLEQLDCISLHNESVPSSGDGGYRFGESLLVNDALQSLRDLQAVVSEQSLAKSLPAREFLKKVVSVLVRESESDGVDVALTTFGTGRVSVEMAEFAMGAILACLRASLRSLKGMDKAKRARHRLFRSHTINLEIHGSPESVRFRLADDGQGFGREFLRQPEAERLFQRVRTQVSKQGGWFSYASRSPYGGSIEFMIPLPQSRFECALLRSGGAEILVPSHCLAEVRESSGPQGKWLTAGIASDGLQAIAGNETGLAYSARVAVADFQYWIRFGSAAAKVKARKMPAEGLVEEGTWFRSFGVFNEGSIPRVLPLLEGEDLMRFYLENRRDDESD